MRAFSALCAVCGCFLGGVTVAAPPADKADVEEGFRPLFDGRTLEGWEGNPDYFRVEDEAIVAGNLKKEIPNNEFLCTTKRFSDFELRLQVRLIGEGKNAGIQFRSERVPNHHEMVGYQADVGQAWDRPVWGGLYDESRRRKMLAEAPAEKVREWTKEGGWNDMRVVARGPHIEVYLNGHRTVDYTETDASIPRDGLIGLQIHSGPPAEAWYRHVRIKELAAEVDE